jgi:CheY-like chemotaxis protein
MNIVTNAADAMPAGGDVTIRTASRYLDYTYSGFENIPEGEYTTLEISDNGIGMPQSDLERIFEPFYTKKVMGRSGTGLGMSVVWGTIKDHDGFIDIMTEEGCGTTFVLYFPATREEKEITESVLIEDYLGQGESILVIDDSREQRLLAGNMMRRLGYTVSAAASGEDALEMIKESPYDLIILDMIMDPGINGLQTYQKILQFVSNQKAVIASGFSETDMVRETQRLGAGAYVKKPYTLEKIGLAVRSELDRK